MVNIEKSRIVKRPEGEPTFDIFYHLLAGANSQLKFVDDYSLFILTFQYIVYCPYFLFSSFMDNGNI